MASRSFSCGVRIGPTAVAALLVAVCVSMCAVPARAVITDTDWSLKISEREMAFRPASDMMAMKSLMWDLPYSRMYARSMPFICLTNESATASITEFRMTIGDEQFNFGNSLMGMYAKLGKESPTAPSMTSSVVDGGNQLVVSFLNGGLAPGKTVQFQFDIDVDAALAGNFFQHPDYRTVLFDMNGDNYYELAGIHHDVDNADNSKVTIKFEQSGQSPVTVGPVLFEDPSIVDGSAGFVNNRLARYGQNDPVRSFSLQGGGGVIPEPGSVALAALGLLGLVMPWRRSRK